MNKNISDIDWEKFEKTGNIVDYLKYKSRQRMNNIHEMSANDMEIGVIEGARDIENIQGEGNSN